jgi:hypothetical protein
MSKKFTIGYIEHDKDVFDRLLGPSLANLSGCFDIIKKSDSNFPAYNYNEIIKESKTPYIILTHQDVTFSPDLLLITEKTIEYLNDDFGALGMVGVDVNGSYRWSSSNKLYEVDTLDCCFIVVKKENVVRFDEENFGDYHLYVEDYCAQLNRKINKKIYTIFITSSESNNLGHYNDYKGSFLNHHSVTLSVRGTFWGRYNEFRTILEKKWPGIKTT